MKLLMLLIPDDACHQNEIHEIKELSRFLSELSVCDYFFVQQTSIDTGLAALLTAVEIIDGSWKPGAMDSFLSNVESIAGCDYRSQNVMECSSRLKETYIQGGFPAKEVPAKDRIVGGESPVCVSNAPQYAS